MAGLPELYRVYPATVARIAPFGAFCSILGFTRDGLLHVSQMCAGMGGGGGVGGVDGGPPAGRSTG